MRDAEMMMAESAYGDAFSHFKAALAEVPEPQGGHYEATRAVTGIADCYYFLGKYEQAEQALRDVLLLPEGAANAYIRLRRGQVFHHLGDAKAAATEWTCAFLNGGREVFDGETDCNEEIGAVLGELEAKLDKSQNHGMHWSGGLCMS
jgi:tetratricopeptide (TPR) repeat protein